MECLVCDRTLSTGAQMTGLCRLHWSAWVSSGRPLEEWVNLTRPGTPALLRAPSRQETPLLLNTTDQREEVYHIANGLAWAVAATLRLFQEDGTPISAQTVAELFADAASRTAEHGWTRQDWLARGEQGQRFGLLPEGDLLPARVVAFEVESDRW